MSESPSNQVGVHDIPKARNLLTLSWHMEHVILCLSLSLSLALARGTRRLQHATMQTVYTYFAHWIQLGMLDT